MRHTFTVESVDSTLLPGWVIRVVTRDDGAQWRAWITPSGWLDSIRRVDGPMLGRGSPGWCFIRRLLRQPGGNFTFGRA